MAETQVQQKLHGFLQCAIYLSVIFDIAIFVYANAPFLGIFSFAVDKLALLPVYLKMFYSKLAH